MEIKGTHSLIAFINNILFHFTFGHQKWPVKNFTGFHTKANIML